MGCCAGDRALSAPAEPAPTHRHHHHPLRPAEIIQPGGGSRNLQGVGGRNPSWGAGESKCRVNLNRDLILRTADRTAIGHTLPYHQRPAGRPRLHQGAANAHYAGAAHQPHGGSYAQRLRGVRHRPARAVLSPAPRNHGTHHPAAPAACPPGTAAPAAPLPPCPAAPAAPLPPCPAAPARPRCPAPAALPTAAHPLPLLGLPTCLPCLPRPPQPSAHARHYSPPGPRSGARRYPRWSARSCNRLHHPPQFFVSNAGFV